MEYQVRDARITDAERITALIGVSPWGGRGRVGGPLDATDLLRQLVYLPNAVVIVADARRRLVGAAVLALRPSVTQGGMVGTIDALAVDPEYESAGVADALLEEVLRSARNKGCVAVEADGPGKPAERARWEGHGFTGAGSRIVRDLTLSGAARG